MESILLGLMRSGLFNGLDNRFITNLIQQLEHRVLAAGEWVLKEGDPADDFFIVLSGNFAVVTQTEDGEEVLLDELEPGDHFGEQALLLGSSGRRMASVRAIAPRNELLRLGSHLLHQMMSQDSTLGKRLKALGQKHLESRLVMRTRLVRELMANVRFRPQERTLHNGEVLFRQYQKNEGFFVIRNGSIELLDESKELPVLIARLGSGLCVGERDLDTYSTTAIARDTTHLLAFPREALLGISTHSSEVREHLSVMQQVWNLPQQGFVTQYLGMVDGMPCLTQLYSLRNGRSLIATHVIGEDSVRLEQADCQPKRTVLTPDGTISINLTHDNQICSLHAKTREPVLGLLFGRAIEGHPITPQEERSLTETGQLVIVEDGFLCTCLRVRRSAVLAALQGGANDLTSLQQRTGVGLSCGSCLPHLREILGEKSFQPIAIRNIEICCEDVCRVHLQSTRNEPLPTALPGQHVVLRVLIDGVSVARPYTLSGAAGAPWEVTIKRESNGIFSRWLFEKATAGTTLEASCPQGDYVWDGGPAPVICFVAGIGITPALAFARTLLQNGWPHTLVIDWSTRFPRDLALLSELQHATATNLKLHTRFTSKTPRLNAANVQTWVQRFPSAIYFLCGSRGFMDDVAGWLKAVGVSPKCIRIEEFNP